MDPAGRSEAAYIKVGGCLYWGPGLPIKEVVMQSHAGHSGRRNAAGSLSLHGRAARPGGQLAGRGS